LYKKVPKNKSGRPGVLEWNGEQKAEVISPTLNLWHITWDTGQSCQEKSDPLSFQEKAI